tara:strand:- start:921 stop:1262 length:342 start_codon:yes stop_codon:yes gene_type:complete
MIDLALATSEQKVPVVMRNASDAVVTGLTSPTITASKGGGSFASLSDGTWAEVGNGLYTIRLNDTDTDTLGWMMIHVAHGSAESAFVQLDVSVSPSEKRSDYVRMRNARINYI